MSKQVEITEALLDRLAALAEKATPGPWKSAHSPRRSIVDRPLRADATQVIAECVGWKDKSVNQRDAAYIAAASPDVVRALVALVRRELAEVTRERDALEAEVVNLRIAEAKA